MTKLEIGDLVEVTSDYIANVVNRTTIQGRIEAVFDILFIDGTEGNFEFDIRYDHNKWIRYKPSIDGGIIKKL